MKVIIRTEAMRDLVDGRRFYDEQQPGVGAYFLDTMFAEIDSLAESAGVHRRVADRYQKLTKIFPYCIYYRIVGDVVHVQAVLDLRREPRWIDERLGDV